MVTLRRKILRRAGALATLVSLALPLVGAPAAVADDAITHQDYADMLGLKDLHAKGYTGKGVTIAYLRDKPNLKPPDLQGANIKGARPAPSNQTPTAPPTRPRSPQLLQTRIGDGLLRPRSSTTGLQPRAPKKSPRKTVRTG